MRSKGWVCAMDFGTTRTAGGVSVDGREDLVTIDGERGMPSTVCWKPASNGTPGRLLLGDEAENEAAFAPERFERRLKRKLGQEYMLLGDEKIRVTDAIGAIFRYVLDEEIPRQGGVPPRDLRLTHPALWGEGRLAKLREAATYAGLDAPLLVPEPVGAAVYFAEKQLAAGENVAVLDAGGGTFDIAVLERTADGFAVVGKPGGRDDLGGEDFDDQLYRHLGAQLDPEQWQTLISPDSPRSWQRARHDFKHDVRRAKERLSRSPDAKVRSPVRDAPDLQVTQSEFENLICADVDSMVRELEGTIERSGTSVADLSAIYLAGGSSQIPLVARRIEALLGTKPRTLGDPKGVVALGACRANVGTRAWTPPSPPPPTKRRVPPPEPEATVEKADAATPTPPAPTAPTAPTAPAALPREPRAHNNVVGGSIAILGAVAVIAALFVKDPIGLSVADRGFELYMASVIGLGLVSIALIAAGLRFRRRAAVRGAAYVGAFLAAQTFALIFPTYSEAGVPLWLASGGAVAVTAGSLVAAGGIGRPRAHDSRLVPALVVAGAGFLVLVGSLFLTYADFSNAWSGGVTPKHYPIVMTALALVGLAIVGLGLRGRRDEVIGVAAVAAAFLCGQAFPLVYQEFDGFGVGFWLGFAGALAAFVASAAPIVANDIAQERSAP